MDRLIIADAGLLIIFAKSNQLALLKAMADHIVVTRTVMHECTDSGMPGAEIILKAVKSLMLSIVEDAVLSDELNTVPLDLGEKSTIAFALSHTDPGLFLLIDENRGRAVAKQYGLNVIGSAGLLVAAKRSGLIDSVEPILRQWQKLGYFLKETLIARVLSEAGESNVAR